jgi:hypothetical protein
MSSLSNTVLNFYATKKKYTLVTLGKVFNSCKYLYIYLRLQKLLGAKVPATDHADNSQKYKELCEESTVEAVLAKKYSKVRDADIAAYLHSAYDDTLYIASAMMNVPYALSEIKNNGETSGVLLLAAEDWTTDMNTHNKYGQYLLLHYDLLNTYVAQEVSPTAAAIPIVRNHVILGKVPQSLDDLKMHDGAAQFVVDLTGTLDARIFGENSGVVVIPCGGLNSGSFAKSPDNVANFATALLSAAMSSGVYIVDADSSTSNANFTGAGMLLALTLLHKIGQKLPQQQFDRMYQLTHTYAAALLKNLNIISTNLITTSMAIAKK